VSEGKVIESEIDRLLAAAWVTASEGRVIESEMLLNPTNVRVRASEGAAAKVSERDL
jgi:hypothetical protein